MDHEKCYVFKPTEARLTKRRRINRSPFESSRELRESTYRQLWSSQHQQIHKVLEDANRVTLDEVLSFLHDTELAQQSKAISTAFILAGPDTTSHGTFFEQLSKRLETESSCCIAVLSSSDGPNLKALLKSLIRKASSNDDNQLSRTGARLLDYDLQILHNWMSENGKDFAVVAIQDSEALDAHLLGEMVELMSSWNDRITFILLLGIATSVEIFQDRLSRSALRCMHSKQFDVVQSDELLERVFASTVTENNIPFRIGPALGNVILQRQKKHIQGPENFVDTLQYAYMSHFYANPLSIFLKPDLKFNDISSEHLEAVRNTSSFRRLVNDYLQNNDKVTVVRTLLESDKHLFDVIVVEVRNAQQALTDITSTIQLLDACRKQIASLPPIPLSSLYLRALDGELLESATMREFFLTVKKAPSDLLSQLLSVITPFVASSAQKSLDKVRQQLKDLLKTVDGAKGALRSQHDMRSETLRTTVVAHKVQLSKHKATISEDDAAYSRIADHFYDWLKEYVDQNLKPADEVLFAEIVMYDIRGPDKAAFMPKHRFAVERALSSPHDYLNCECCKSTGGRDEDQQAALAGSQPMTALLYQLYLESGSSINVTDLWSAFSAMIGDEETVEDQQTVFLFQCALAELRYLGLVKSTRRKMDHIAKVSWKGL